MGRVGGSTSLAPEAAVRRVVEAFEDRFGASPEAVSYAPGRVSLLGAHVDYSEGLVLSCAIERGIAVAASSGALDVGSGAQGAILDLQALDVGAAGRVEIPAGGHGVVEPPEWAAVPVATAQAWAASHGEARPRGLGLRAVFGGDLPIGAGVSSSAALEVALLGAWRQLDEGSRERPQPTLTAADRLALARLARRTETEFLGVGSGLMDPHASLFGERGKVVSLDCRSETHEMLPLAARRDDRTEDDGTEDDRADAAPVLLLVDSGVRRRLVGSGFGDRRAECARAVEVLRVRHPEIRTLRDATFPQLEASAERLGPLLHRRARHAVWEIARVRVAAEALRQGRLEAFGAAMRASHESSRDLYDTSIPELDVLASAAWSAAGCYGARLTGAGFGGLVVALVAGSAVDSVRAAIESRFEAAFGRRPASFTTRASGGARFGEGPGLGSSAQRPAPAGDRSRPTVEN